MRPDVPSNTFQIRSRKSSLAEQNAPSNDLRNGGPVTFSIRRGSQVSGTPPISDAPFPVQNSQNLKDGGSSAPSTMSTTSDEGEAPELSRRRSTIKGSRVRSFRRDSSGESATQSPQLDATPLTPLLLPSNSPSAPASPKSTSTRSLRKSDEESTIDETGSQAITSSGEEEPGLSATLQDSAPQLVMPSIKMPSRRPFTERGKRIGRFKILIAGAPGSGKTSLIKSIVQLCEDIVHVDPLNSSLPRLAASHERTLPRSSPPKAVITEIYASTKPYPSWWTEMDESRILRRRKSMGDAVLERNLCFVDTCTTKGIESVVEYMQQQLYGVIASSNSTSGEFLGLLSGRGGPQVDVILYLISQETLKADCECLKALAEVGNVVPLVSKADVCTSEQIEKVKNCVELPISALPKLPMFNLGGNSDETPTISSPYTVSSAAGPDMETMDASLLMSPEYVQPLVPSALAILVQQMLDTEVISYLRHSAAKKLVSWHARHPRLIRAPSPEQPTREQSTLASPLPSSLSNSGVLVPMGSDLSLTTSNSYALAKLTDHTQREERLAQVRLSKWAAELQLSLQRERERYEKLVRGERATWLLEKMSEEVRDGQVMAVDNSGALIKWVSGEPAERYQAAGYVTHDPLGLLRWNETLKTRGWLAVQVVGSVGVIGGLALWVAKTWGFTSSLHEWAEGWSGNWLGHE